ncbi:restriction endonuclease subunit S [Rhodopirellula sp. P2]|uniref:restriction endonuclease subunit S n=1 Tax=Rhodopirellula sp. P2 TaxID=2127060 RepID=UPI0023682F94|nr:restriction endonuclease subunit S [Rhodopirellula sp. P2]WDQ17453.1 restriction endonuclease subunit S [Rhodopirellula sp. P2]
MAVKEELPDGWTLKHLVDVADVARGKFTHRPRNDPRFYGGTIPFVQTSDVVNSPKYLRGHSQTLSELGMTVSRMFPENTILMVIAGSVGASAITKYSVAFPDSIVGITPRNGYSPEFIHHVLVAHQSLMDGVATESAQANLSLELISMLKLALPSPETANWIAEILDAVDDATAATRAVIEQTRKLKTALLQDLLSNGLPGKHKRFSSGKLVLRYPSDWKIKPLSAIAQVIDCKHRTPVYEDQGFPVVRPGDVTEGLLDLSQSPRTSQAEYEDLVENYRPVRGDIVYSRNASFGVAAYADTDEAFTIGQDVVIITSKTESNRFLYYLLNSHVFKQQLRRLSAGSTFQRINLDDIRRYQVVVPSLEEQDRIVHVLWEVDQLIERNKKILNGQQVLKLSLSQGLLTGRIPISGGCHG